MIQRKKGALGRNILLDTLGAQETPAPVDQPSDGIRLVPIHKIIVRPGSPAPSLMLKPLMI